MTRVFVAGPIDFEQPADVLAYRLQVRRQLENAGFTPVDQYTPLLERFADVALEDRSLAAVLEAPDLPEEPFLDAIQHAVAETSAEAVRDDPGLVPKYTPEAVVEEIVARDFGLLANSEALLGYLPRPSCGTMAEIVRATEHDVPVVVVSDRPPHYVQFYADEVVDSLEHATQVLRDTL